jgi:hypothetical protein
MNIYMSIRTLLCVYVYVNRFMHEDMYMYIYVCMYTYVYKDVNVFYISLRIYTSISLFICIYKYR